MSGQHVSHPKSCLSIRVSVLSIGLVGIAGSDENDSRRETANAIDR